jgi:hypothetical protein
MRRLLLQAVAVLGISCAREPSPAPTAVEPRDLASKSRSATAPPAVGPVAASSTLGRPCTSHDACTAGELCFTDTTCASGSCQKAKAGCDAKTCDCLAPGLCRTVCVERGGCVACSMPPPPP